MLQMNSGLGVNHIYIYIHTYIYIYTYIYICMPSFPPSPIPPCPHFALGTYCRRCSTCPQAPPGPRPRRGLGPWPPWELQRRPCRSLCLTMGRCPQQKGGDGGWGIGDGMGFSPKLGEHVVFFPNSSEKMLR